MIALAYKALPRSVESLAWSALAVILITVSGWIYLPGVAGPALLDDYSSVDVIPDLSKSPELALEYVLGNGSGPLGRPVSMASFVLESMLFDRSIETSKQINIGLHLINGCLIIWMFTLLFRHIRTPDALGLAVLLGAAWTLSPLFVSTVLYVVQRMAMLATSFMLLTIIAYLHWRIAILRGRFRPGLMLAAVFAFLLAMYSKENAIVVVPLILLLETLWFEFKGARGLVVVSYRRVVLTVIALGIFAVCMVLIFGYEWLGDKLHRRHFTLTERLLTEARILWDYVAQIYLPEVSRMGIYHDDVSVSSSIFEPLSTLYSVLGWVLVLLVCGLLLRCRYGRYFVFGIAFFLVGHSIESTVLSLELYFEHRNYFPGIGLFLCIGVLFAALVKKWPPLKSPLLAYVGLSVLLLASQTSSQVQVWSNPTLLVLNNFNAHPGSFRANADMAMLMISQGDIAAARKYSASAFSVSPTERGDDHALRDLALSCMVDESINGERFDSLGMQNPDRPFSSVHTLLILVRMLQDNACPNFDRVAFADRMKEIFLTDGAPNRGSSNIYSSLAVLENALERFDNAHEYTAKFLILSPGNTRGLLMKLHFTTALNKTQEAEMVVLQLQKMYKEGKLTVGEQQTLALYTGK